MGRKSSVYARASRRAALLLHRLSPVRGRVLTAHAPPAFTCPYCSRTLTTSIGRKRHIILQPYCRARRLRELHGHINKHLQKKRRKEQNSPSENTIATNATPITTDITTPQTNQPPTEAVHSPGNAPLSIPLAKRPCCDLVGECDDLPSPKRIRTEYDAPRESRLMPDQPTHAPKASTSRTSSGSVTVDFFPIPTAGAPVSDQKRRSTFSREDIRDYLASCGPMGEPERFEVAELLMTTGLTGKNRTRYLKSCLMKGKRFWRNNRGLLKDVNHLPYGPKWVEQDITLLGDSRFRRFMRYAPEKHWTSHERKCRLYGEMWSGNWWWRMQWLIGNPNGTVVPLIIASDKTTLSTMAGGQQAYPVYLTIGNISKDIRRKASKRATIILGYLPVDSFKDVSNRSLRSELQGELLHRSMEVIMEPLKTASSKGVPMWCADGYLRHVYPTLAAFVGDWPEQNDASCTVRSGCPICQQLFHGRGSGNMADMRCHEDAVAAFRAYKASGSRVKLKQLNLKPWKPFWIDLPNVNFPNCITPDILHQLHKGVFKNYVAEWTEELLGEVELDERYMAMPKAKDLRHFKRGITSISQWTGRETKEMAKQYLPIVAEDPNVPDDFVRMVRALLDFLFLAERAQLSKSEVQEMEGALRTFHSLKQVLVRLELILDVDKFDYIPKFHMLSHYAHSIRELGTPDGFNTESPEHLHIVYAKRGWRASNRREAIRQIVRYICRLEAIRIQRAYLDECYGESPRLKLEPGDVEDDGSDSDDDDNDVSDGSDDEGEEEIEEDNLETSQEAMEAVHESSGMVTYPRPTLSVAVQATCPRLTGHQLVSAYGAIDLTRSLVRFLKPLARNAGVNPTVFLSNKFDIWHKLKIQHRPIPFALDEHPHRDVIRIRPPSTDQHGRRVPGLFDTALFLHQPLAVGLQQMSCQKLAARSCRNTVSITGFFWQCQ
ncbi:Zn-finger protein [Ceratobasidium sp. AG-Ba]|nr:Zn-finger protein [Ceratobasidium sp. AG-Ba]